MSNFKLCLRITEPVGEAHKHEWNIEWEMVGQADCIFTKTNKREKSLPVEFVREKIITQIGNRGLFGKVVTHGTVMVKG